MRQPILKCDLLSFYTLYVLIVHKNILSREFTIKSVLRSHKTISVKNMLKTEIHYLGISFSDYFYKQDHWANK